MKKTGLSKVLKLGALGVLVLIVLVFTFLYMSKTELNVETNQGKGMESAAPKDMLVDYVGKYVKRGEPLFTVYSPDLVSTEEESLLALKAQDSFGKSSFPEISSSAKSLLEATRRRLLLWDIP